MKATWAQSTPAGWIESDVRASDECEYPGCREPYAFTLRSDGRHAHPAARAWRNRLVCWEHARDATLMSERYRLGIVAVRVRGNGGEHLESHP